MKLRKFLNLIVVLGVALAAAGCGEDDITNAAVDNGIPLGAPYHYGYYTRGALAGGGWSGNFLQGMPVTVTRPTFLTRFGIIPFDFATPPTQGKMGVYRDNAGAPGALVKGTDAQTLAAGRNEFQVYPRYLSPGNYWIVFRLSSSTNLHYDAGSQARVFLAYPFANAWPDPFPPPGNSTMANVNIYMTVAD